MSANGTRPAAHTIIFGDPGSGKSTCATTWPKPMLVHVFDAVGKDGPYMRWARSCGFDVQDEQDEWGTPVKVVYSGGIGGTVEMRLEYYNDISPESRSWELYNWRMKERAFFNEGWATLVIDSVTFMELAARMHARHNVAPNAKEPRQWFAYSTDALEYALLVQLQSFPGNLVVLAHVSSDKDETLGMFLRQIAAPGRLSGKNELAAGYSELYHAYVVREKGGEEQYLLQTRRDAVYHAATQIDAPDPSWQSYDCLWDNFK